MSGDTMSEMQEQLKQCHKKCPCNNATADLDENNVVHIRCPDCGSYALMSLELFNQIRGGEFEKP